MNWKKTKLSVSSHRRLLGYLYKLVGFRYLPQPLKEICWFYSDDMDDLKCLEYLENTAETNDVFEAYDWSNRLFYESIENLTAADKQDTFHFYHIKGLHVVRNLDKDFNDAEDVSLEETARAMFKMLNRYFDKMKAEGIYDNSVIIIMADHGAIEYPGGNQKLCPLLLVKGIGEEHDFTVSDSPVSYADLQKGYHNLLNGTNPDNIFEVQDENCIRYFYLADWLGRPLGNSDYSEDFTEYSLTGDAFESTMVEKTGKVYSNQ
ncbi:MAG: sulfatase-like hydrolase/transferase [Lachnospiraceae bacterium]